MAMNIYCQHNNFLIHNYPIEYCIFVDICYENTTRLVYYDHNDDDEEQTISYLPLTTSTTYSNPLNPYCPHCKLEVVSDYINNGFPNNTNYDIDSIFEALHYKVDYMTREKRYGVQGRCSIVVARQRDIECSTWLDLLEGTLFEGQSEAGPTPAAVSAIEKLERVEDVAADGEDCVVCLEELDMKRVRVKLPCKHVFHEDCVIEWLRTSHMCPLCRFELPIESTP